MNAREWFAAEFESGPLPKLGSTGADVASGGGGPVYFTAEDFEREACGFEDVARVAMIREHLHADDPLILRFIRYAEMLRYAARELAK